VPPACSFHYAALRSFQHRTARVARYCVPLHCTPYRATLAFSNRTTPTQEKRCSSFALGIASCQATTAHFWECLSFNGQKISCVALQVSAMAPSLSCCLHLGCHPHGSLLCLLMPLLYTPLSLRSIQPQRIHRLPVFLLACGSLRADRDVRLFAVNPVPTVASFHLSFLFPFIQPLSAPHTRVAHSLHYTSQHNSIPQYGCLTFNWYLMDKSRCQILQHEQQPLIASFHPNNRFVPSNRYPCLSLP